MKKLLLYSCVFLILASCAQSPEDKANALIKENMKKILFKPETYKPIETNVDSAFTPYDDTYLFEALVKLGEWNSKYDKQESKARHAKSSMSIWSGSYQSAYGRNQYLEAKRDYEEASSIMEKMKPKGIKLYDEIVSMLKAEPKFIGYVAEHNYRADNNAGNTLIGNYIFFFDKEFKEITYRMTVAEYNQAQETIEQLLEEIEEE